MTIDRFLTERPPNSERPRRMPWEHFVVANSATSQVGVAKEVTAEITRSSSPEGTTSTTTDDSSHSREKSPVQSV